MSHCKSALRKKKGDKRKREKSEKRFGEMIETLTFAPRSKRREGKREKRGREVRRESEDARAKYEVDNNE